LVGKIGNRFRRPLATITVLGVGSPAEDLLLAEVVDGAAESCVESKRGRTKFIPRDRRRLENKCLRSGGMAGRLD
jgi:hypothetical protein